ncbi:hypothetical protein VUR80DRAFT_3803 [Thermomyces stellatus]
MVAGNAFARCVAPPGALLPPPPLFGPVREQLVRLKQMPVFRPYGGHGLPSPRKTPYGVLGAALVCHQCLAALETGGRSWAARRRFRPLEQFPPVALDSLDAGVGTNEKHRNVDVQFSFVSIHPSIGGGAPGTIAHGSPRADTCAVDRGTGFISTP